MSELPNSELSLPPVKDNTEQILNDIQSLQQMEQQLLNNLESNINLNSEQQQQIVEKMNQLSNMRINLYQTLSGVNNYYESALNSSVDTLKDQEQAIRIVESELNKAKSRLQILEEEKNNKIRLVEINTYFGDKYAEHTQLMKIIIYMLVPIIILALLNNKGILPSKIYYILIVIISLIGGYFFWRRFASIIMRDNMNYQEYAWSFDPNKISTNATNDTSDPWNTTSLNIGTCIGNACCATGLIYDTNINQCILRSNTNQRVESMAINNVLTKQQPGKFKNDYDLRHPNAFNM
jgi:hypothetical protein